MEDWLSYSLGDFLPFSRETYGRLFEHYNTRHWPAVLIGIGFGAWLWAGAARGVFQARLLALLGLSWLWIAWFFLWRSYTPLNWPVGYAALGFALQGVLLITTAFVPDPSGAARSVPRAPALGMLLFAWLGLPLMELLTGSSWQGIGWLGSAPDPTALATLAVVAALRPPLRWALAAVPVFWCIFSGLTLLAMGDPLWFVLPLAATLTLGLGGRPKPGGS